jgi:hypothetical protein
MRLWGEALREKNQLNQPVLSWLVQNNKVSGLQVQ